MAAAVAVGAIALALSASGSSSEDESAVTRSASGKIGFSGASAEPCGVAVSTAGDVYVASPAESSIEVLDREGNRLTTIRNANQPCDLAVDSAGRLYALETRTGRVVRYSPSAYPFLDDPVYGQPKTIDSGGEAEGIGVDLYDDRLYVAKGDRVEAYRVDGILGENERQRVLIYRVNGGTFTLSYEGAETPRLPYDISHRELEAALWRLPTIGRGNVEVEEGTNGPMDHFVNFSGDLGRSNVRTMKAHDKGLKGRYVRAEMLREGFSGEIGRGTLEEATDVGAYTYNGGEVDPALTGLPSSPPETSFVSFEPPSSSDGERLFVGHRAIRYHGRGRHIYVADAAGSAPDRVDFFAGQSVRLLRHTGSIDGSATPAGRFAFGRDGGVIGVDPGNGHFFVYDDKHAVIDEFEATGPYVAGIEHSSFAGAAPTSIAVDRARGPGDGSVLVAAGEILAFDPLPTFQRVATDASVDLDVACAAAFDSEGNLYATTRDSVAIVDPGGETIAEIEGIGSPCDVAVDSVGSVYVSAGGRLAEGDEAVLLYEPDSFPPDSSTDYGDPTEVISLAGQPPWVAVDPTDDRLFASEGELSIAEYASAAEGSELLNDEFGIDLLKGVGTYSGGLGVCVSNGNVYAAGRGDASGWVIYVISPDGTELLTTIDGSGSPKGIFPNHAQEIALDQSNCHVLMADYGRAVEEYEASGAFVDEFGQESRGSAAVAVWSEPDAMPGESQVDTASSTGGMSVFGPLAPEDP